MKFLTAAFVFLTSLAPAHHPDGPGTVSSSTVVARVEVQPAELTALREKYLVLGYLWRHGIAVIQADAKNLPAGARIDATATARLRQSDFPIVHRGNDSGSIPGFPCYRTVEQTYTDLASLAQRHPQLAEWIDYGDSWEKVQGTGGYDLNALVLTNRLIEPAGSEPDKPVLMIMAAMHARELTTAETATRFAEFLIAGYGMDADITWILDYTEVHILPHQNPDGRKLAETGASWRKNTNEDYCPGSPASRGADLNRNASTLFWGQDNNANACSLTHHGAGPGSEPETAALEAYQLKVFPDQRDGGLSIGAPAQAQGIFISLHSYGEYVFYPWEGTDMNTGNENGYRSLSQRLAAITDYAACQNCCLGTAAGTAVDFAYEELGVASLTFELGTSFFQSCAAFESDIWPVNRDALLYAAKAARRPYLSSSGPVVSQVTVEIDAATESAELVVEANDAAYAVNNPCPPRDPTQPVGTVARVEWSVDDPPWQANTHPMIVADGAFDATSESATASLSLSDLGTGSHVVFIRAIDNEDNPGPPTAVFVEIPVLFADNFEATKPPLSIGHEGLAARSAH